MGSPNLRIWCPPFSPCQIKGGISGSGEVVGAWQAESGLHPGSCNNLFLIDFFFFFFLLLKRKDIAPPPLLPTACWQDWGARGGYFHSQCLTLAYLKGALWWDQENHKTKKPSPAAGQFPTSLRANKRAYKTCWCFSMSPFVCSVICPPAPGHVFSPLQAAPPFLGC